MRARCPRGPVNPTRPPVPAQSDHQQFICRHYPPSDTRHSPPLYPCGPIPPPPSHPEGQRPAVSLWLHVFGTQWGWKQTNKKHTKKPTGDQWTRDRDVMSWRPPETAAPRLGSTEFFAGNPERVAPPVPGGLTQTGKSVFTRVLWHKGGNISVTTLLRLILFYSASTTFLNGAVK